MSSFRLIPFQLAMGMALAGLPCFAANTTAEPLPSAEASLQGADRAADRLKLAGLDFSSAKATQGDLARARVFDRPLVAIGEPSAQDTARLASALQNLARANTVIDHPALAKLVADNPDSPYAPALLVQLAQLYYREGYYSRALDAYETAWRKSKACTDPETWPVAMDAAAGYAKMLSRVGRRDELTALFSDVDAKRPMWGHAAEQLRQAREGLEGMIKQPGGAFRCGPLALHSIAVTQGRPLAGLEPVRAAASTPQGFSLSELEELSAAIGMPGHAVRLKPKGAIPVPAVIHMKIGHYAAIIGRSGDRYILRDPTFGEGVDVSVSAAAIREEGSGFFLVFDQDVPSDRLPASLTDKRSIHGRGLTATNNPDATRTCDTGTCGNGQGGDSGAPATSSPSGKTPGETLDSAPDNTPYGMEMVSNTNTLRGAEAVGMAVPGIKALLVSLSLNDTPLLYTPAYGPDVFFHLTYNERENNPLSDLIGNFGPRWSFNWMAWINESIPQGSSSPAQDGPEALKLAAAGGGAVPFERINPSATDAAYYRSPYDNSQIRNPSYGLYYITQPDGSVYEYNHPVGITAVRPVLLGRITDPAGNQVVITYDGAHRIQTITDAAGRVTTFSYTDPNKSNRITKIQLDDGRSASFTYTTTAPYQLKTITDAVGLVSEFTYGDAVRADRITQLTTPYGNTSFAYGESSAFDDNNYRFRWIEITDPLGAKERMEYHDGEQTGVASSDLNENVPNGDIQTANDFQNFRNSFHWSKRAYQQAPNLSKNLNPQQTQPQAPGPGDYALAHIFHWVHQNYFDGSNLSTVSGDHLESELTPGEARVFYNYEGQSNPKYEGSSRNRTRVGRVVPHPDGAVDSTGKPLRVSQISAWTYTDRGLVKSYRDPVGREWRYTYAANGIDLIKVEQLLTRPDPNDPATWTYQTLAEINWASGIPHLPAYTIDAARQTTSYTYNSVGQIRTVTNAKNEVTTYWYHPTGQGITPTTTLSPTAVGYLVRIDGPLAGTSDTVNFTYDAQGRVRTYTDTANYTLTYTYDNLNRATRVDYPDNTYVQLGYDKLDLQSVFDRAGRLTTYGHDAMRRTTSVTDPANRVTRFEWCGCGALEKIIDPRNRVTRFQYDAASRLTHRHFEGDQLAGQVDTYAYTYDIAGRLSRLTDARQQTTDYRYALDGHLGAIVHGNAQESTPDSYFTYDPVYPRLTRAEDRQGATVVSAIDYGYHPITAPTGTLGAGRLASVNGPIAGALVGYAYDELGRLKTRTLPGQSETWTYDALGRVGPVVNPLGTFNYAYVGATARLDNVARSGGLTTTFGYQPLAQDFALAGITTRRPDNSVVGAQAYVQDHLRGLITDWDQTAPDGSVAQWDYRYTEGDELETARRSAAGATTDYAYRYDDGGNRVSEQVGSSLRRWQVNGRNQLEAEEAGGWLRVDAQFNAAPLANRAFLNGREVSVDSSSHRVDALTPLNSGNQTLTLRAQDAATNAVLSKSWQVAVPDFSPKRYVYDGNGNLSRIEQGGVIVRFYRWDARNRLAAWGSGTTIEGRFEYDSSGQRIRERNGSGAIVRQWVWAGGTQPVQERDGSGTVTRRYFSQGEMRRISGQEVARYYVRDHLGSVRAVTDASNNVVSSYAFDPYGRRVKLGGTEDYDIAYTGHYNHQATGLSLTFFRAYDADTGKWLSRDPIEESDGPNMYAYVQNDPVNGIDPLGLWQFTAGWAWGAGGSITFGYNGGRANAGYSVGFGVGGKIEFSPSDSGSNGMKGISAKAGFEIAADATFGALELGAAVGISGEVDECNNYEGRQYASGQAAINNKYGALPAAGGTIGYASSQTGNYDKGTFNAQHGPEKPVGQFGIGGMVLGGFKGGISW